MNTDSENKDFAHAASTVLVSAAGIAKKLRNQKARPPKLHTTSGKGAPACKQFKNMELFARLRPKLRLSRQRHSLRSRRHFRGVSALTTAVSHGTVTSCSVRGLLAGPQLLHGATRCCGLLPLVNISR